MRQKLIRAVMVLSLGVVAVLAVGLAATGARQGSSAWAVAAGEGHEHGHERQSKGQEYSCPMGCEGAKTYSEPGRCPKCGMTLVAKTGAEIGENHEEHGAGHQADMGHMAHMNEVRRWLQAELSDAYDATVAPATPGQLQQGAEIYARTCVACHGPTGKGDGPAAAALPGPPADFTDAAHSRYYSDMGRILVIRKGVSGTPMAGWESSLSEADILAVHAYVRSLRQETTGEGHVHDHDMPGGDDDHGQGQDASGGGHEHGHHDGHEH